MGKKDKHRPGQSRNNPIFKVVGGKAGKTKNMPQEVNIKLKNVSTLMYLKEALVVNTGVHPTNTCILEIFPLYFSDICQS